MKYLIPCFLAVVIAVSSCKKKTESLPVTLSATVTGDSAFTTTNVRTDNKNNGIVYISATGSADQHIDIAITGYNGGKKTFLIDYRGPGGNINGNTVMYRRGSNTVMARTGKIVITEVSGNLMKGTFTASYSQTYINGTFTAATQ